MQTRTKYDLKAYWYEVKHIIGSYDKKWKELHDDKSLNDDHNTYLTARTQMDALLVLGLQLADTKNPIKMLEIGPKLDSISNEQFKANALLEIYGKKTLSFIEEILIPTLTKSQAIQYGKTVTMVSKKMNMDLDERKDKAKKLAALLQTKVDNYYAHINAEKKDSPLLRQSVFSVKEEIIVEDKKNISSTSVKTFSR